MAQFATQRATICEAYRLIFPWLMIEAGTSSPMAVPLSSRGPWVMVPRRVALAWELGQGSGDCRGW